MSFSSKVKSELCLHRPSGCCKAAECYGLLLFSRAFSCSAISMKTEHRDVANRYASLLRLVCGVSAGIEQTGQSREIISARIPNEADRKRVLHKFGYHVNNKDDTRHIEFNSLGENSMIRECCLGAFIRGAFLACGSIIDPHKEYHMEFLIPDHILADEFKNLLIDAGLLPRITCRGKNSVIYFKESDNIEDLLTFMDATQSTLEIMNIRIYKDVRNKVNRQTNCETANLTKTVNASVSQLEAIDYLEENGIIDTLPTELVEAANLRRENPDMSLSELCKLSERPVTRSGFNHRLRKLVQKVSEHKEENET